MATNEWTNADGLTIRYGAEQAAPTVPSMAQVVTYGCKSQMVIDVNYDNLPAETSDLDNDGTRDGWNNHDPFIPGGSYITAAYLIVETAFAGGTSYDFGLSKQDGTAISANGLDDDVLLAALDADSVVVLDGALVGGTVTIGADNAYLKVVATGTFTAGKAKLVIEYITVDV